MSARFTRVAWTWNRIFVPLGVSVLGVACNSSKEDTGTVRSVEPDVPAESVSGDATSSPEDSSASPSEDQERWRGTPSQCQGIRTRVAWD